MIERRWTQAEYRRLPEGPHYYELEEGELIEMVRPLGGHQKILRKLNVVLDGHLSGNPIGDFWPEVAVDLTSTQTYIPDISFLLNENLARFVDDVAIEGPPDLVVEIVSPSTAARDRAQKLRAYHRAGVPWYWLVESDSLIITEDRHTAEGYLVSQTVSATDEFTPHVFPGLRFKMADLMNEVASSDDLPAGEVSNE
jgi:Uma2 family endonuclease